MRDRIAMTIAVGLVSWGLVLLGSLAWRNRSLSEGGGEIFLAIAAGLVAALTTYFAKGNGPNNKPKEMNEKTKTTNQEGPK